MSDDLQVASLEGRRRGGESRHGHRRGHEHTSTVGTRHLTLPPSSPSLPRNSRPTSRLRSSTTNNNDSKNANSNGAANPNTNSLAAAAASATNFNSPDSAATGSSTSASTAAGDTIPAAAIANPARRGASTLSQGPSDGGSAASGQSVVRRVRPAMALGLATAGQGVAGVDGVEGAASAAAGAVLARNNRTERGQRLRALNWAKQVRLFRSVVFSVPASRFLCNIVGVWMLRQVYVLILMEAHGTHVLWRMGFGKRFHVCRSHG